MPANHYGRLCPSVERLMLIKDVTEEDAKEIRRIWREVRQRSAAREQIDKRLRTHGIEFLGIYRRTGNEVYYCNAGDTYATTVLFHGRVMWVGCWGDLIEMNRVKPFDQL